MGSKANRRCLRQTAAAKTLGVLALLVVAACRPTAEPVTAAATSAPPAAVHREVARAIVREHCGLCHTKHDVNNGLPDVTHIFDVDDPDWSQHLSDDQLAAALDNLAEDDPDLGVLPAFERFISDELAWRDAHPMLYPPAHRQRPRRGTTQ
jgi:hypothetical protein